MSNVIERLEDHLKDPGRLSRRTFTGLAVKACFAVAAATTGAIIPMNAFACTQYGCCCLALPCCCSWCASGVDCYSCPGSCYTWTCTVGGSHLYTCIECYAQNCSCSSQCCGPQVAKEGVVAA
jgi:hypothetical protein